MNNQDTYFVADSQGAIKIGRSYSIRERMGQFQRDRDGEITLLAIIPGGDIERELHHRFAHLRIDGEWYRPEPEILEFIEGLNCKPMTLGELNKAKQRLGWGFRPYDHPCVKCGEVISRNHLLYPDFEYRYEHFYRHGKFICLLCYHRDTRLEHICDRLVWTSVTRPLDWPKIWRLQTELAEILFLEDDYRSKIDTVRQPRLL